MLKNNSNYLKYIMFFSPSVFMASVERFSCSCVSGFGVVVVATDVVDVGVGEFDCSRGWVGGIDGGWIQCFESWNNDIIISRKHTLKCLIILWKLWFV